MQETITVGIEETFPADSKDNSTENVTTTINQDELE